MQQGLDQIVLDNAADYLPYISMPIIGAARVVGRDVRPRLFDPTTQRWMLLDSGAMCTVWPLKDYPGAKVDPMVSLEAVNKTKIPTSGSPGE